MGDSNMDRLDPIVKKPKTFAPPSAIAAPVCPICKGAGHLVYHVAEDHPKFGKTPWMHPQFGKTKPCACLTVEQMRKHMALTYSWLGAREDLVMELESMTFATFNPNANGQSVLKSYRRAKGYAELLRSQVSGQMNATITGPYGVGKTHLAVAVLNHVRVAGIGCLFASGNEFFQALFGSDFDESIIKRATDIPVLCLDDLDKMQVVKDGSYQKSTLFTLFNARYIAKRPVIITANVDDDWRQWVHPAVISRLFGKGKVEAISMVGEDYRMMGATNG
jgi:DNA replication protein DnaC